MSKIIEEFLSTLLVEGNDDQHVVWAICEKFRVNQTFDVVDCVGIHSVLKQISVRVKLREPSLGVLIDADTNLQARWMQLQNILTPLGYDMPATPDAIGTILKSELAGTTVGIWIMPDNQVPGMLEDFVQILIPDGDEVFPVATKIVDEILGMKNAKLKSIHRSKAIIHTWLAWQESPGTPMGSAIVKTYLDHNHELCLLFVAWLNRLFNSGPN